MVRDRRELKRQQTAGENLKPTKNEKKQTEDIKNEYLRRNQKNLKFTRKRMTEQKK